MPSQAGARSSVLRMRSTQSIARFGPKGCDGLRFDERLTHLAPRAGRSAALHLRSTENTTPWGPRTCVAPDVSHAWRPDVCQELRFDECLTHSIPSGDAQQGTSHAQHRVYCTLVSGANPPNPKTKKGEDFQGFFHRNKDYNILKTIGYGSVRLSCFVCGSGLAMQHPTIPKVLVPWLDGSPLSLR